MALGRKQEAIELVPVDDSIAESPHPIGNRLAGHAHGSSVGWVAASMRLEQNLTDANAWTSDAKLECDLTQEWLTYAKCLQSKPKKYGRPMRVKNQVVKHLFYHMGLMSQPVRGAAEDPDVEAILPITDEAVPDDDEGPAAELPRRRPVVDVEMLQQSQSLALMKEYMLASLCPGKFVSFKVADHDDDATMFVQIVLEEPRVVCVDLCTKEGSDLAFRVAVQERSPMVPVAADHASLSQVCSASG